MRPSRKLTTSAICPGYLAHAEHRAFQVAPSPGCEGGVRLKAGDHNQPRSMRSSKPSGAKGGPLTDKAIYRIITERTRAAFGQPVNPHLFRSCAATTIVILDPGRIGLAADLLDHASLATTHAHYIKARSIQACRLYAKALAELTPRAPQERPR